MKDYIEIQNIFMNFCVQSLGTYLKDFEEKRKSIIVISTIILVVLCGGPIISIVGQLIVMLLTAIFMASGVEAESEGINSGVDIFLALLLPLLFNFAVVGAAIAIMSAFDKNLDKDIKNRIFPNLCNKLSSVIPIKWEDAAIDYNQFSAKMKSHNIIKVNKNVFQSDDRFSGSFHGVNFKIYEIINKLNFSSFMGVLVYSCLTLFSFLFTSAIVSAVIFFIALTIQATNGYEIVESTLYNYSFIVGFIIVIFLYAKLHMNKIFSSLNRGIFDQFRGVFVDFEYKKPIKGHTVIIENNEENMFIKLFLPKGYQKVQLEDEKFNAKFAVYSTDQIEARYALTTAMMDRLLNLKHNFRSKYIRASFRYNKFVIAIQADKDMFKLASLWKKTDETMYKTMVIELISILKITDALHLNDETGL